MAHYNPPYETTLADKFAARPSGLRESLTSAVEMAPWWVASFILHTVFFSMLALLTVGGMNDFTSVDISAEFESSPTPIPTFVEEEIEDRKDFTEQTEQKEDEFEDPEFDPEDEDKSLEDEVDVPDNPFDQKQTGAMGLGPGHFQGVYRNRPKGKPGRPSSKDDPNNISDPAVQAGLKWLADHQEADGHWDAKKWGGNGEYDTGVTGLALLAFAGAGNTERSGKYVRTVRKCVQWLCEQQDAKGCFAPKTTMYSHAIPTLALLELAGMHPVPRTHTVAEKALRYMLSVQNDYKAWRYWPKDGDNDISVTTWCVMAMKAAVVAGIDVPAGAWSGVRNFVEEVTEQSYGEVGYVSRPVRGASDQPYQRYSMTACGMLIRLYMGVGRDNNIIKLGRQILVENMPEWNQPGLAGGTQFYYYWYYGSLVMFQLEGDAWKRWNAKMLPMLVQHQNLTPGELLGSWDPTPATHFCQMGGRVYSTAMAVLTLEVYYRYALFAK